LIGSCISISRAWRRDSASGDAGGKREGGGRRQLVSAKPARFVYPGAVSMAKRWNDARLVAVVGLIGFASTVAFVLRQGGGPGCSRCRRGGREVHGHPLPGVTSRSGASSSEWGPRMVRIEAPPDNHQLLCLSCGGPLRNREGKFATKYFRVSDGAGLRRNGRRPKLT
jgi:hypothetical protein